MTAPGFTPAVIEELFRDVDRFLDTAGRMTAALDPCREKDLLTATLDRMREVRAGADADILARVDALQADTAAKQARLAELQARLAELQARLDQPPVPPPVAMPTVVIPAPPAFTVDTALGPRLRAELLAALGVADAPAAGNGRPGRDVWEGWADPPADGGAGR